MVTIKITNEKIFSEKINDIDTSGLVLKGTNQYGECLGFSGTLEIEEDPQKGWYSIEGDHYPHDYEEDFGFILISE